jgi:hypothetical protein
MKDVGNAAFQQASHDTQCRSDEYPRQIGRKAVRISVRQMTLAMRRTSTPLIHACAFG